MENVPFFPSSNNCIKQLKSFTLNTLFSQQERHTFLKASKVLGISRKCSWHFSLQKKNPINYSSLKLPMFGECYFKDMSVGCCTKIQILKIVKLAHHTSTSIEVNYNEITQYIHNRNLMRTFLLCLWFKTLLHRGDRIAQIVWHNYEGLVGYSTYILYMMSPPADTIQSLIIRNSCNTQNISILPKVFDASQRH